MNKIFLSVCAITLGATAATAQATFEGDLNLGYSFGNFSIESEDIDLDTFSLRMHSTVSLSEALEFDLNVGHRSSSVDGVPLSLDTTYLAIAPRYTLANGLTFGAYFDTSDNSLDNIPVDFSTSSYGLSLGKNSGTWDIEGFIGVSDYKILDYAFLDADVVDMGVRGGIDISDQLRLSSQFIYTQVDTPYAPTNEVFSAGLGGQYLINDNWAAFGSLSRQSFDERGSSLDGLEMSGTRYSVGTSYTFYTANKPVVASLEWVRTDVKISDSSTIKGEFDEIRLGVTIPLGHSSRPTPTNSNARNVVGGGHSALTQLIGLY